jgi:putative ABC transport system permease protein
MWLAWSNLLYHKVRTAVAVIGVAFSLALIFVQLGFLGAVRSTATLLYDKLDFDVMLLSRNYTELNYPGTFPCDRVYQAQELDGVERVAPVYLGLYLWRNPLEPGNARYALGLMEDPARRAARLRRNIRIVGFRVSDPVFAGVPEVDRAHDALKMPDTVLIDTYSRREFGPRQTGVETELGPRKVQIVGQFTIGTGMGIDGMILTSDETFHALLRGRPVDLVSLGLIKLKPGVRPETAAAELNRILPPDVQARTRQELMEREKRHWIRGTPAGVIFFVGVILAVAVGMVFVYQVISGDIQDHLRQYATLKAIGYGPGYLAAFVLQQAVVIALAGYLPGLLAAWGVYALTRWQSSIVIGMTPERALAVLVLAIGMCGLSGLFALHRVTAADPADLF